jgi:uncharacterized protein
MVTPMPPTSPIQRRPAQPGLFNRLRSSFSDLDPIAKGVSLGLCIVSLGLVAVVIGKVIADKRTYQLTLAAGSASGESYSLSKAIEAVVEAEHPRIQINVIESSGTQDNLDRLDKNQAQLATAQADVAAGPQVRTIAILYSDNFQLIVPQASPIKQFIDLKGKRIGLQTKGGQYKSFLEVANHFGLAESDFTFIGNSDQEADQAFRDGQADAIFRVRAIGNPSIATLIQRYNGRLVPIEQAQAMRLKVPAFEPNRLPRGAYQGSQPVVPAADLETIAVQRLLVARSTVPPDVIQAITRVLNEHRRELMAAIPDGHPEISPLVASIAQPSVTGGTGMPLHPGAADYYNRNNPSFIQENADYVGLLLTLVLLLGSWGWELKNWLEHSRKNLADEYVGKVIDLMKSVQNKQLDPKDALDAIDRTFGEAANALVDEGISQESFRTFNEAYKTVREVIIRKI